MAFIKLSFILLFCSVVNIKSSEITESSSHSFEDYSPHILAVLNYLNANPNKVYEYKQGTFVSAQQKADIIEITVDVDVNCLNKYPGVPCSENVLTCHCFVRQNVEQNNYQVLSDVNCRPKIEISVENDESTISPSQEGPDRSSSTSNFDLSHEAISTDQAADFVAVRRDSIPCLGCPFDLNTDAEGVDELVRIGLKHIEMEKQERHVLVKVLRLQQQIVAGVKYILLLEIAPTTCSKDSDLSSLCVMIPTSTSICEVTYIQKPWISKTKHIIKNNCTSSQEYSEEESNYAKNSLDNEIDPNNNVITEHSIMSGEMNPERLTSLESQILFGDMLETSSHRPVKGKHYSSPSAEILQPDRPSSVFPSQIQEVQEGQPIIVDINRDSRKAIEVEIRNAQKLPIVHKYLPVVDEQEPVVSNINEDFEKSAKVENSNPQKLPSVYSSLPIVDEREPITIFQTYKPFETYDPINKIEKNINNKYIIDRTDNTKSESELSATGGTKTSTEALMVAVKDENLKRELKDVNSDSSGEAHSPSYRHKRELRNDKSDSKSDESNENTNSVSSSEENKAVKSDIERLKRELKDVSSVSSGEGHYHSYRRKRELRNDKSDSKSDKSNTDSASSSEENKAVKGDIERLKRELKDADSDSNSAESNEKSNTNEKSLDSKSHENNKKDNSLSSSEEDKAVTTSIAPRRRRSENKNDESSSSSSSSESDNNNVEARLTSKQRGNDDDSSSSSDDDNNENEKKKNKDGDNDNESSSSTSEDDEKREKHKRSVGQLEKISPDEKIVVRNLADFAAAALDDIDDDNHKRVILQILGAKKLKLDGTYYQLILRLGISHCLENEYDENCRDKLFTNLTKICKVQVHVENEYSTPKVVKSQCQNIKRDENDRNRTNYSRYRRELLAGGISTMSVNDPKIQEFAKDTLTHLDSKSDHDNKYAIVKILSASSQVVAGVKYIIKAQIDLSNCEKKEQKPVDECDILENSDPKTCDIIVWDQPWLSKRQTSVKCDDKIDYTFHSSNHKSKRSVIVGGITKSSTDDPEIQGLLRTGLLQLDSHSSHENRYKIIDVLSASKQVVSGTLWRVKARVTLSDCKKNDASEDCGTLTNSPSQICDFKIWDQPWLHNKQVNVTCEEDSNNDDINKREAVPQFVGGYQENFSDHPEVKKFVEMGLRYLESKSLHQNQYTIKKIKTATKQSVAGHLWRITAEISLSNCPKHYYSEHCDEVEGTEFDCDFKVWDRQWLPDSLQINISCQNNQQLYSFKPAKEPKDNSHTLEHDPVKLFKEYVLKHNKLYINQQEYNYRLKVFRDNLNTINLLNKYELGTAKYGLTQFADLTQKEFSKSHGLRTDLRNENDVPFMEAEIPNIELPVEFDWRQKGAVTEVKNQGMCGSCWAFSVTGDVEGQYAIKHGKLLEFSEQELVDCDKVDDGCNGGLMDNAYRVIEQLGGLESESDYPYEGEDEKCHFNKSKVEVQLTGAVNISHNETDMAKWLVQNGPISIAINANAMQFYMGGVSHPWKALCNPKSLDHGVLIVGYGVHVYPKFKKSLPFWIVKNSWGKSWGEQGYYRVYRGDGTCGLNQTPSSAIVA